MYDRLTAQGRAVIANAQAAAQAYNHNYVGTEHILLGLVQTPGVAAEVLQSFGITANAVDAKIRELVGVGDPGGPPTVPEAHAPWAPHGRQVIESSNGEATRLGHEHVDTEHILLGLLAAQGGVGGRILLDAGADRDAIRAELHRRLSAPDVLAAPAVHPERVAATAPVPPADAIRVEFSPGLRRVLMTAGARALDDGRGEINGTDLLLALTRDEALAPLLAELGLDEPAVRDAIARLG